MHAQCHQHQNLSRKDIQADNRFVIIWQTAFLPRAHSGFSSWWADLATSLLLTSNKYLQSCWLTLSLPHWDGKVRKKREIEKSHGLRQVEECVCGGVGSDAKATTHCLPQADWCQASLQALAVWEDKTLTHFFLYPSMMLHSMEYHFGLFRSVFPASSTLSFLLTPRLHTTKSKPQHHVSCNRESSSTFPPFCSFKKLI